MTTVYEFPHEWYDLIVTQKMRLRSASQSAGRAFIGARSIKGPHAQYWLCDVTMAPTRDPDRLEMDGFFARLAGQAGLLRISDASRLAPWYDRNATTTAENFSDGAGFTDGTGFVSGLLPPEVFVYASATARAGYVVLGGFPASTANVLRRGDLLQIKPGGIDDTVPHFYMVTLGGDSDASGRIGVQIAPGLRTGVAAGDPVSLRHPSGVFRLVDDQQAEIEITDGGIANFGFSLVEALDQVP